MTIKDRGIFQVTFCIGNEGPVWRSCIAASRVRAVRPEWAVRVDRHNGRYADIRCALHRGLLYVFSQK
ncbi:hypothetical protein SAMN04488032_12310 [Pacificibacter marinus]|uniref:Uncharacterized protein n=1 Tax=Pacificibacter marinus TaxID=658057 RepID=A0A1Y5TJU6_9RHOB|nr:hypothetical protein SAMN04488032_12310 [Pacificibacter marinus]SLN65787.1 hypothetical protein PAM7971_03470 [Pacificibacter marinus]